MVSKSRYTNTITYPGTKPLRVVIAEAKERLEFAHGHATDPERWSNGIVGRVVASVGRRRRSVGARRARTRARGTTGGRELLLILATTESTRML